MDDWMVAVAVGAMGLVGTVSGAVGAFAVQWYRSRNEAPKVRAESNKNRAEARKARAEAAKVAADAWHELYDEVCERLGRLEKKCKGLKALVADVEALKLENNRLRNQVNLIIHWYTRLYHQALDAGIKPEFVPPEPEEIEEL